MGTDSRGTNMTRLMRRLWRNQKGATAIEYGLIAALIVIAAIPSIGVFADVAIGIWGRVDTTMAASTANAGT
jgi:pilus assembly protein Flp/PilA